MVIEELEDAQARGATIYAEVVGVGISARRDHDSAPDANGANPALAMQRAMADAVSAGRIGYINAHGTRPQSATGRETRAMKIAFGEEPPPRGGYRRRRRNGTPGRRRRRRRSGVTSARARGGILPPTINHVTPDPDCDLDDTPNKPAGSRSSSPSRTRWARRPERRRRAVPLRGIDNPGKETEALETKVMAGSLTRAGTFAAEVLVF